MNERPAPRPEGRLLADALKKSGMSAREAASRVGISEARWRQIVTGYQNMSKGVYAPVRGPAGTVAKMAQVTGVSAEELQAAERADAADELTKLIAEADAHGPPVAAPGSTEDAIAAALKAIEQFRQSKDVHIQALIDAQQEQAEKQRQQDEKIASLEEQLRRLREDKDQRRRDAS